MSFVLGLTGSMGMGKTTTARMFADEGCAVWDADDAVHRLYAPGGDAVAPLARDFPDAIVDGAISRQRLKDIIERDHRALDRIEAIVHPLVEADRRRFIESAQADIAVLDIPLLFETGQDSWMDAVVCVSAPPDIQRQRVLARGSMSEPQVDAIIDRQMPDAEKRRQADYVVETDTLEHAREQVHDIVTKLRGKMANA